MLISFRCTTMWFNYTYTCIIFQILFTFRLLHNIEQFPVLYSMSLLVIHFKNSNVYIASQFVQSCFKTWSFFYTSFILLYLLVIILIFKWKVVIPLIPWFQDTNDFKTHLQFQAYCRWWGEKEAATLSVHTDWLKIDLYLLHWQAYSLPLCQLGNTHRCMHVLKAWNIF